MPFICPRKCHLFVRENSIEKIGNLSEESVKETKMSVKSVNGQGRRRLFNVVDPDKFADEFSSDPK